MKNCVMPEADIGNVQQRILLVQSRREIVLNALTSYPRNDDETGCPLLRSLEDSMARLVEGV